MPPMRAKPSLRSKPSNDDDDTRPAERGVRAAQRTVASVIAQLDPESVAPPAKVFAAPKRKA